MKKEELIEENKKLIKSLDRLNSECYGLRKDLKELREQYETVVKRERSLLIELARQNFVRKIERTDREGNTFDVYVVPEIEVNSPRVFGRY